MDRYVSRSCVNVLCVRARARERENVCVCVRAHARIFCHPFLMDMDISVPGSRQALLCRWRTRVAQQHALARLRRRVRCKLAGNLLAAFAARVRRQRELRAVAHAARAERARSCVVTMLRLWRRYFARHVCSAHRTPCPRCRRALAPP